MRLRVWLQAHESGIAARWYQELTAGSGGAGDEGTALLKRVVEQLVSLILPCFGEQRELGREIWENAAHLYGSLAVRRGLAAGEVVEELQILRNVILRLGLVDVARDAEGGGEGKEISPRDFLTLNKVLDLGVSCASIAYVDDLFFSYLQGSPAPEGITPEFVAEMERQLEGFRKELAG